MACLSNSVLSHPAPEFSAGETKSAPYPNVGQAPRADKFIEGRPRHTKELRSFPRLEQRLGKGSLVRGAHRPIPSPSDRLAARCSCRFNPSWRCVRCSRSLACLCRACTARSFGFGPWHRRAPQYGSTGEPPSTCP
jgi:hypothetical protein